MGGASQEVSSFVVHGSRGTYSVDIGFGSLDALTAEFPIHIVDRNLEALILRGGSRIDFDAQEAGKTLQGVEKVLAQMGTLGATRDSTVLAVGGGVVQDVVTLAASLYMRGIGWAYSPTTVMSMVDSCLGGKSSINVGGIKNLAGNIYPPRRVLVDIQTSRSLPVVAKVSGFAEAVKICFARGASTFEEFQRIDLRPSDFGASRKIEDSIRLTDLSLRAKKWFIEIDEFDKKERLLLNFGHTFAHALEAAVGLQIPHGVAVAIGMGAAIHFDPKYSQSEAALLEYIHKLAAELPADFRQNFPEVDWDVFREAISRDKKGNSSHIRFVLPDASGLLQIVSVERAESTLLRAGEATALSLRSFLDRVPVQ